MALGGLAFASDLRSSQPTWERTSSDDGVIVYRRLDRASDGTLSYYGVGDIDAELPRVMRAIVDTPAKTRWNPSLKEARVIRQLSAFERIDYSHFVSVFPFQERDFVFQASLSASPEAREVYVEVHSVEDASMPVRDEGACCVRGIVHRSLYTLSPLSPSRTRMRVELSIDPGGAIPKWIANWLQRTGPRKHIQSLRRRVQNPEVTAQPEIADFLARRGSGLPKPRFTPTPYPSEVPSP